MSKPKFVSGFRLQERLMTYLSDILQIQYIMKNNNRAAQLLGFWSAVLCAIMLLWFSIAFGLYQPVLHAPWSGMPIYEHTFEVAPFLAWAIPCFLLTFCFLFMMICIHTLASREKKLWSLLSLVFAITDTVILSVCYYIKVVVVEYILVHHSNEGLIFWLFAPPYPHSIPGAIEGIGYLFMSMSLIFASRLFSGNRLSKWIKWTFLFSGLTGFIVSTDTLLPLPLIVTLIDACANAILFTSSLVLVSIWFRSSYNTSSRNASLKKNDNNNQKHNL